MSSVNGTLHTPAATRPGAQDDSQTPRAQPNSVRSGRPQSLALPDDTAPFYLRVGSPSPSPYLKKPWKKLLYLPQAYPDNYTDPSFLSQLKRNTTVAKYSYSRLVADFSLIVLHLSSLMLVALQFTGIYLYQWDCARPALFTTSIAVAGFAVFYRHRLKSFIITSMLLLMLTPVMRSLTRSTASDSIWALSFCLCVANILFHDYGLAGNPADYRPILSTNISVANAIVLASRLTTNTQVFLFVLFAIEVSILFPLFDVSMRYSGYTRLHRVLFTTLFAFDCGLILHLMGAKFMIFWCLGGASIMFGLPGYFLFLQKYKNEMMGPWDPAKPKLNHPPQ
ncbi:phosphatidylinositol N-acetylglucosaminyltransferase Gpi2p subunit [Diutina catenulata]